jgi:hypothetical protein
MVIRSTVYLVSRRKVELASDCISPFSKIASGVDTRGFGTFTTMLILRSIATLQITYACSRVNPRSCKEFDHVQYCVATRDSHVLTFVLAIGRSDVCGLIVL